MTGTCRKMESGSFTPSMCKKEAGGLNNSTTASVDAQFPAYIKTMKDTIADPKKYVENFCCAGKVAADADIVKAWACEFMYMQVRNVYYCNKDWKCGANPEEDVAACDSLSAMMTAVCTLTADEIKTEVDKARDSGGCMHWQHWVGG